MKARLINKPVKQPTNQENKLCEINLDQAISASDSKMTSKSIRKKENIVLNIEMSNGLTQATEFTPEEDKYVAEIKSLQPGVQSLRVAYLNSEPVESSIKVKNEPATVLGITPNNFEIEVGTQLDSKLNLKILYPAQLPNITVMPIVSENLHSLTFQFFAEYEKDILIPDIKYFSGSYIPKQENITLYAWYKASNNIQITLKHNWTQLANFGDMWLNDADLGVNYTMDDVVVTFSDLWYNNDELTYKIIDYTPKRSGYTFLGWALTETGDVIYKSNEPIYGVLGKFKQNNTLYAKWQKI